MKKLSAYILTSYFALTTYVMAADPAVNIAEIGVAQELAGGIHAAEHASKGGLPQFDPTWFASQAFWLIICFSILYVVFSKVTLPEISNVIENRKNLIESDLETAEKLTKEADNVHDTYNANLANTHTEAAILLKKSDDKIKAKYDKKSEEFRETSENAVLETEKKIVEATSKAMADMNKVITEVSGDAIEKIIGKKADSKKIQSIVENLDNSQKSVKKVKAA